MTEESIQKDRLLNKWINFSHGFFSCDEWIHIIYQSLIYHANPSEKTGECSQLKGRYVVQKPPGMTPKLC